MHNFINSQQSPHTRNQSSTIPSLHKYTQKINKISCTQLHDDNVGHNKKQYQTISIIQDKMEQKFTPIKSKIKRNNNKSFDEIGVSKCKMFKDKIKLKSCFLNKNMAGPENAQTYLQGEIQQNKNIKFAELYRINLRKTVFNETKTMIKKNKQKHQNMYSIDNHILCYNQNENLKTLNSSIYKIQNTLNTQQKISQNLESLNKSPSRKEKHHINSINQQLGIAKLPLLMKHSEQTQAHISNLLMTLKMRQQAIKAKNNQKFKQISKRSRHGKFGTHQKQEIKPWQTFADQFVE